jgi:alpha-beta hydrolase superfamily lysophospholipase
MDINSMTLLSIPANPVPEGAVAGTIATPDGVTLRFARWAPPAGGRGTVCVFTGRGEYIEKYFETVQDLRTRGYAVAVIDWRGQGHSSRQLGNPRKGHVRNFSEYEIDVQAFVKQVVLPECPPPYFALAHSMGGAVMLRVAHAGIDVFERFVLCAPMIDLPGPRASLPMRGVMRSLRAAGMGERFIPGGNVDLIKSSGFPGNPLTSDPRRYARNVAIRDCVADGRVARRGLCRDGRASFERVCGADSPAGPDARGRRRHRRIDPCQCGVCPASAGGIASRDCGREARNAAGRRPLSRTALGGVRCVHAGVDSA